MAQVRAIGLNCVLGQLLCDSLEEHRELALLIWRQPFESSDKASTFDQRVVAQRLLGERRQRQPRDTSVSRIGAAHDETCLLKAVDEVRRIRGLDPQRGTKVTDRKIAPVAKHAEGVDISDRESVLPRELTLERLRGRNGEQVRTHDAPRRRRP